MTRSHSVPHFSRSEIWLLDCFGRFLHHDPDRDQLSASAPQDVAVPGLILRIRSNDKDEPFVLEKRHTAPMPLPQITPVAGDSFLISLQITDKTGPYSGRSGRFISATAGGEVSFGVPENEVWTHFVPIPAASASLLFPFSPIVLSDRKGEAIQAPTAESGWHIRFGDRFYPLHAVSDALAQCGALQPGESADLVLPACMGAPALSIKARHRG